MGTIKLLRRSPWAIRISLVILTLLVIGALFAPLVAPYDPDRQDLIGRLLPPLASTPDGDRHLLGTDHLGRDVLSRVIYGARISMMFALLGTVIGLVLGTVLGIMAGFAGGRTDQGIMFLVDLQQSIPFIVFCLMGIAIFGTGLTVLIPLIGLAGWDGYARYARGGSMAARNSLFVLASRSTGAPERHIAWKHVLPNAAAPIIVVATLNITGVIILESSLSFLGIGVQPPTASWGNMISEGRQYLGTAWWMAISPGLAMIVTTLSITLLGDWLRDSLDPTTRQR
jgi:peptide/nickel transport system permease protein